jgi:hypothetical protein
MCHEDVWGSGRIEQRFLDLGISWRRVVSSTPRQLYPRYTLDRTLGVPQSRSGRHGDVKILAPAGILTQTPRSLSPYPPIIPTMVWRLVTQFPSRFQISVFTTIHDWLNINCSHRSASHHSSVVSLRIELLPNAHSLNTVASHDLYSENVSLACQKNIIIQ